MSRAYSQCSSAVSVTSTGTFSGGSTGTNYDTLADALQGNNLTAGVCDGGTISIYININENPAIFKNVIIQGVGNVSWSYSSGELVNPADSGGVTIENMTLNQGGSFALLTTSGNVSANLYFIQDTINESSSGVPLINFANGAPAAIGVISFLQSVLIGNGTGAIGLNVGLNTNSEGGFLFENSILCGFSDAVSITTALPSGYLTFLNSDLANSSSDALYSSVSTNSIAVTNTAFIGNGADNNGFSQSGFDDDAFGTDSLTGYTNSIAISSSDFIDSGASCSPASSTNLQQSASSKLKSAGVNLYASGVQNDILGNPRPSSGAFDMGAYQATLVSTPTNTLSATPTNTVTPTFSPSLTNTFTPTATNTLTPTFSPSITNTPTPTPTNTITPTFSLTNTPTLNNTATPSSTASMTPTVTWMPTVESTLTPTCLTHVWPNPYNPQTAVHGTLNISCMSETTVVNIYTVSGEWVISLNSENSVCQTGAMGGISYCWNGRNKMGYPVATGIYFYVILQGNQVTQRGKFLLVNGSPI